MKIKKLGFTLLELLVVIGIIAVLVSLGASSYSTAQKKARDSKRKGDLRAIQSCMEQYYSDSNYVYQVIVVVGNGLTSTIQCDGGGTKNIGTPTDPLNDTTHKYIVTTSSKTDYKITATLESGGTFVVSAQQ